MSYYQRKTILTVWDNAKKSEGNDSSIWRKDFAGAWIRRDCYGMKNEYGWEIGKVVPSSHNGTDEMSNLQAMHWRNNEVKGDSFPTFISEISSEGSENVEQVHNWVIKIDD